MNKKLNRAELEARLQGKTDELPVISDMDLSALDLSGAHMAGAVFHRTKFNETNFARADLQSCIFNECTFERADFTSAAEWLYNSSGAETIPTTPPLSLLIDSGKA